jgi:hypothetical protein
LRALCDSHYYFASRKNSTGFCAGNQGGKRSRRGQQLTAKQKGAFNGPLPARRELWGEKGQLFLDVLAKKLVKMGSTFWDELQEGHLAFFFSRCLRVMVTVKSFLHLPHLKS